MQGISKNPPGGSVYKLSTECMPNPEGGVQGLAVLSDDFFVTGHDDNMVTVWSRIPNSREFTSCQTLVDHQGMIRAMVGIPGGMSPHLPTGGFATGCMDKRVRVYSFDPSKRQAALVRTLEGHMMGVISLSLTARGELVSGGWEGHARVWDLATWACKAVLEGHENGTKVAGLSDGCIAVGSTGRKNEFNQHVDYKVRIWAYTEGAGGGKGGYSIVKVSSDHEQAVQDIDAIPEVGFVTASNDGTVRVRGMEGSVVETFSCPVNEAEGKPWSAFRARMLPNSLIAACCEDQVLRLYSDSGLADTINLPGTPWCVAGFANGDIVVVGNQAGTSRRGHAYVFTNDESRYCSEMEAARFTKDCEPPAKSSAGAAAAAAGSGDEMNISGPYEQRAEVKGNKDGQMAFFGMPNGAVMLCTWNASASQWVDVGEVTDNPDGDDSMGMGGAAAGAGGGAGSKRSGGSGAGASGKSYDYTTGVTMDTSRGMRSMQLCFNDEDDPIAVAKDFLSHNGLSEDCYEEVKNFVIDTKMAQGESVRAKKRQAQLASGASYSTFPARLYLDFSAGDIAKLTAKLWEHNAALVAAGNASGLNPSEEAQVKEVTTVLADTRRYHATTVPRAGVQVIVTKLLAWPVDKALPAVDLVRMLVLHPDGAEAVGQVGKASFLSSLLGLVKAARAPGRETELRPVALVASRALFNAFKYSGSRALLGSTTAQQELLAGAAGILGHDHATVRTAGTALLLNYSIMVHQAVKEAARTPTVGVASGGGNPTVTAAVDAACVGQAFSVAQAALQGPTKDDAGSLFNILVAIGTLAVADKAFASSAKTMGLPALVASVAGASPAPETGTVTDPASEARKGTLKAVKDAAFELADVLGKD